MSRKFRWTFEAEFPFGKIPTTFVRINSRPQIEIEDETEVNYLSEKTWIPGKQEWQAISTTFYDVDPNSTSHSELFDVLSKTYDYSSGTVALSSEKRDLLGTAVLTLYDGHATPMEAWTLSEIYPESISFGELDYSSSEMITIDVKWKYKSVQYKSFCNYEPMTTGAPTTTETSVPRPIMGLGALGNLSFGRPKTDTIVPAPEEKKEE